MENNDENEIKSEYVTTGQFRSLSYEQFIEERDLVFVLEATNHSRLAKTAVGSPLLETGSPKPMTFSCSICTVMASTKLSVLVL